MEIDSILETQRIDHLGIVAGVCDEVGLISAIDEVVGLTKRKVSCGMAVQAMVLNALGFSGRALYLMPQYLHNKPVDLLIAPGLKAEDFNDDSLGRCLDQLFETGVTKVFAHVVRKALETYGIECRFFHLDSTSFHVHGQYEGQQTPSEQASAEGEPIAIQITHGYSKDHRPDLKQVVVNLITTHRSQLPVWMESLSGNAADRKSFPKTIQAFCKQLQQADECFFVVDSALYSAENLNNLSHIRWLTRVPRTLKEAREVLTHTERAQMQDLGDGYAGVEVRSNYAQVEQRWLVVYSEKAARREEKTLQRRLSKEKESAQRQWRKLQHQQFDSPQQAQAAMESLQKKWKYHSLSAQVVPVKRYASRGRPAAGSEPQVVGFQLEGQVQQSEQLLEKARKGQGYFILATNELDADRLSTQDMLAQYKAQAVSVERGFRFLKDPLFFAHSLFLKNPGRIMALTMIMTLSLLIYSLAERKLRDILQQSGQSIPNQVGKPTQRPTMRWVFQLFEGIDLLLIRENGRIVQRKVLSLTPVQLQIINRLGPPVEKCYLIDA